MIRNSFKLYCYTIYMLKIQEINKFLKIQEINKFPSYLVKHILPAVA